MGIQEPAQAAFSAFLFWLTLNGLAALPFLSDRHALFKVFLNPAAPALFLFLEGLIVLATWLRYRGLRSQKLPSSSSTEEPDA